MEWNMEFGMEHGIWNGMWSKLLIKLPKTKKLNLTTSQSGTKAAALKLNLRHYNDVRHLVDSMVHLKNAMREILCIFQCM
jgi:hypothetical protein